jgi:sugar lactone lactonase YvrE
LYVTDMGNQAVRKITQDGVVTTLARNAGGFFSLWGIAADTAGNVFVSDIGSAGQTISRISPSGVVTVEAGMPGVRGATNGPAKAATFYVPRGLAMTANGSVLVADSQNALIRAISPIGFVTTLAGSTGVLGEVDGPLATARFVYPGALAVDAVGDIYVSDTVGSMYAGYTIRKITPMGFVTTLAGTAGVSGSADGVGAAASFSLVWGLGVDVLGNLYAADSGNNTVRKITAAGVVTTIAGTPPRATPTPCVGPPDGVGAAAKFCSPGALAADRGGNVYVADTGSHTIRRITPSGVVSLLAGQLGVTGTQDGTGAGATFNAPSGIAVGADGIIYVADTGSHRIRKVTPAGVVTTLAGADWENPSGIEFFPLPPHPGSRPTSLAVDGAGTVYAIDNGVRTIRKVTTTGEVSTPTGSSVLAASPLTGIAVDAAGIIYVSNSTTVSKLAPEGAVTLLAGSPGDSNAVDGVGGQARFRAAADLALDSAGRILVVDSGNNTIRRIAHDGTVTTIVGQGGSGGVVLGALPGGLDRPTGLAISGAGLLNTISENAVLGIQLP